MIAVPCAAQSSVAESQLGGGLVADAVPSECRNPSVWPTSCVRSAVKRVWVTNVGITEFLATTTSPSTVAVYVKPSASVYVAPVVHTPPIATAPAGTMLLGSLNRIVLAKSRVLRPPVFPGVSPLIVYWIDVPDPFQEFTAELAAEGALIGFDPNIVG